MGPKICMRMLCCAYVLRLHVYNQCYMCVCALHFKHNSVHKSVARSKHCIHSPEINRQIIVAIHTQHIKTPYKTNTLLLLLVFNLLYRPALASLCAIKMYNGRVKLFQSWPMSNGQHGNAPLNTRTIQFHLPICTHLQHKVAESSQSSLLRPVSNPERLQRCASVMVLKA